MYQFFIIHRLVDHRLPLRVFMSVFRHRLEPRQLLLQLLLSLPRLLWQLLLQPKQLVIWLKLLLLAP